MAVTPTRTRNRRGEGDQLRGELLNAAVELLALHGSPDKVSLRAVASEAGVSPTAVYRHFENHDALITHAVLHCWQEFDRAMPNFETDNPLEDFFHMGDGYVTFAKEQPGRYRVLFTPEMLDLPEVKPASLAVFGRLVAHVERLLQAKGDDRDPFFVATQVHTWIHGMVLLCRDDDGTPWPKVDALMAELPFRLGLVPD